MLADMSAEQFGNWMGFYLAEQQITDEKRQEADMTREALRGAEEIRGQLRT